MADDGGGGKTFPCPSGDDSTCYYDSIERLVIEDGRVRLTSPRDPEQASGKMLDFSQAARLYVAGGAEEATDQGDRPLQDVLHEIASLVESQRLPVKDGVIAVCRPCGEMWVVPLQ